MCFAIKLIVPVLTPFHHHELVVTCCDDHFWHVSQFVAEVQRVDEVGSALHYVVVNIRQQARIHVVIERKTEATVRFILMVHFFDQGRNDWV